MEVVMVMETEVVGTMKEVEVKSIVSVANAELVMGMAEEAVASKIWEMVAIIEEVVVMVEALYMEGEGEGEVAAEAQCTGVEVVN